MPVDVRKTLFARTPLPPAPGDYIDAPAVEGDDRPFVGRQEGRCIVVTNEEGGEYTVTQRLWDGSTWATATAPDGFVAETAFAVDGYADWQYGDELWFHYVRTDVGLRALFVRADGVGSGRNVERVYVYTGHYSDLGTAEGDPAGTITSPGFTIPNARYAIMDIEVVLRECVTACDPATGEHPGFLAFAAYDPSCTLNRFSSFAGETDTWLPLVFTWWEADGDYVFPFDAASRLIIEASVDDDGAGALTFRIRHVKAENLCAILVFRVRITNHAVPPDGLPEIGNSSCHEDAEFDDNIWGDDFWGDV